jgi:hypothetical protein
MISQPATSLFETDLEQRYFRVFSDTIAAEICPYFNPENWSRMILQACATEASVRHAAVAIGALGKTYEIAQAGLYPVTTQRFPKTLGQLPAPRMSIEPRSVEDIVANANLVTEAFEHHRAALEQYDKAIKRMRKDISCGSQTLRTTLLFSIFFCIFESIHGNHKSAAAQVQSGLALVQEWMSRRADARRHPQGFSSPAPDDVEDYLVQTFGRMEIQSMSVFDPRSVATHEALKGEGKEVIEQMPKPFSSVEQARIYLDLITRRLMHYNHSINPRMLPVRTAGPPETPMPWADGSVPQPMPWIDGKTPPENTTKPLPSPEAIAEQSSLTNELNSWTEAFASLLAICRSFGGQDAISALTLSISALTSQISLRSAFFTNESAYDLFLPEFKTIVDYATLLLSLQEQQQMSPRSTPSESSDGSERIERGLAVRFSFDLAVVPPLYTVVIKCRDPHIRRAAINLLNRYPRREGVWDSVAASGLGRWVMALEEEGALRFSSASPPDANADGYDTSSSRDEKVPSKTKVPSGNRKRVSRKAAEKMERKYPIIPEEMRVRNAQMRFDLLERRANMSCRQKDFKSGEFVDKKEVFRW